MVVVLVMLTISGAYAEDIDVNSSSVTESPISADVDTGLSSCDAFNNELSNIYEPSESVDSYGYYESSNILQINEISYSQDGASTIMSKVNGYIGTSGCNMLIKDVTNLSSLVKFENDNAMLAASGPNMPNDSEQVFDSILMDSGYISKVEEVYHGLLSDESNKKLLNAVGSVKNLLFANMAYWYNGTVKLERLQKIANHEQGYEGLFDVNTVTKALLKYDSQEKEWWIYKFSDGEDEQSHVINDNNSHGLDYAYDKHVNVINKDMLNLIVLTPYGIVFIEEQSSVGPWDGLNDILDGISSKTLLPDHQAIWTPLLLLIQQDSNESSVDGHTDDNENKDKIDNGNKKHNGDTTQSDSSNKYHFNGEKHHYKNWGGHYSNYITSSVVNGLSLEKVVNSTNNETNSTNSTVGGYKKAFDSPKIDQNAEPTYTLVYAIIGIVIIGLLFNSSYMKRDD